MEGERNELNGPAAGFEDDDDGDGDDAAAVQPPPPPLPAVTNDDPPLPPPQLPPPEAFDGTVNLLAEGPNAAPIAHVDELDSSDDGGNQSSSQPDDGSPPPRHCGHVEIEAPIAEPPPPPPAAFQPTVNHEDDGDDEAGVPAPLPPPEELVVITDDAGKDDDDDNDDEEGEEEEEEERRSSANRDSVILTGNAPAPASGTSPSSSEGNPRPPSLADVGQQKRIDFVDIGGREDSPDLEEEVKIIEDPASEKRKSASSARLKSPPPPQTSEETSNGDQDQDQSSVVEAPHFGRQRKVESQSTGPDDEDGDDGAGVPAPRVVLTVESPPPPAPVVIIEETVRVVGKPPTPVASPPPAPTAFVVGGDGPGKTVERQVAAAAVAVPPPQQHGFATPAAGGNNVILCGEDVYQQVQKKPMKNGNGSPPEQFQPPAPPQQQAAAAAQRPPFQYQQQPAAVQPHQFRGGNNMAAVANVNAIVEIDPTAASASGGARATTKVAAAGKQHQWVEDELPLTVHVDDRAMPAMVAVAQAQQQQQQQHSRHHHAASPAPVSTIVKMNPDGATSSHITEAAEASRTKGRFFWKPGQNQSRRHSGRLAQCGWSPGLIKHAVTPKNAKTAAFVVVSFVYAKLILVACVSFLLAEIATYKIPLYFFEGFFTYLYGVSILFLLYVFCYLLQNGSRSRAKRTRKVASGSKLKVNLFQAGQSGTYNVSEYNREAEEAGMQKSRGGASGEEAGAGGSPSQQQKMTESLISSSSKPHKFKTTINESTHGSFFLRVGCIVFGLGTLIYCGLELGAFFEVPMTSPCHDLVNGLNPALQMAFTFMQMYFVFMNAKLNIHKFKVVARFGLMHLIATNACVWMRTVVREGMKDFTKFYVKEFQGPSEDHLILARGNLTIEEMNEKNMTCERVSIMGSIREDAAPYLYPIVVEYSLIAAVVLFVMWLHIGRNPRYICDDDLDGAGGGLGDPSLVSVAATPKVDCVGASKGLFVGLLLLICAMISTILFFILIDNEKFHDYAVFLADSAHSGLLLFSLLAVLFGFCRVKKLKFNPAKEDLLNALCLRISAFGILLYGTFTTIAGAVKFLNPVLDIPCLLVLVTGALTILEASLQVLFVSDAAKRSIHKPELNPSRPGRQLVTILLLTNITMWGIYTFEAQKVDRLPVQINFYGSLPWAVLLKLTLPLCIFHRFHASVVLADIWKNGYKPKCD